MAEVSEKRNALIDLIDKIEQLGQFQDRIDFPANIRQIWRIFLNDLRNLIDVEVCALFLVDDDSHEFALRYVSPEDKRSVCQKEINFQIECGIFSWIINRRQPSLIPSLVFENESSIIMLPLTSTKRTLGVVLLLTPIQESYITQENMKLLTMLAKQYSLVMENTILYERLSKKHKSLEKANGEIRLLSRTDSLTGCYNRGYLNEHLPHEIKRALRYRHSFSITLCDIDHFKKVNDTFGHQCGDLVLREFVQWIMSLIRTDMDWLARYGGEEFLLVLPETSVGNAVQMAERLRKHLAKKIIEWEGEKISITASFGVTGFNASKPFEKISPENLINTADRYLYQAKEEGRNRVRSGQYQISD
ncbi:MAG: sensor domain-containing diguanylate cyclase [Desulfobacterales bacterium]|jgi:diguanylate cyclase (GGDEF)-like protein